MSVSQETNNQNRVPAPDDMLVDTLVQRQARDSKYYYDDGNIVFLVEGVLFKLLKSFLLSHMEQEPLPPAKITRSDIEHFGKGMGGSDPLVVSEVTAQQFRWFLLLLLGTPADPEYISLFISSKSGRNPTVQQDLFCHLGIYAITQQFGMSKLHDWSYSQLEVAVQLATRFINAQWDKETIMQAVTCVRREKRWTFHNLHAFILLALYSVTPNNPLAHQPPLSSNLDICVALYKDPDLPKAYPDLFGYVFAVILSLGHRSSVWTNQLTREDRSILYAAQVHLVSLDSDPDFKLSWLSQRPFEITTDFCSDSCGRDADIVWKASFARSGVLGSAISLADISTLVLLPRYRQLFTDSAQSKFKSCKGECADKALARIDEGIEDIFYTMRDKYEHFVKSA